MVSNVNLCVNLIRAVALVESEVVDIALEVFGVLPKRTDIKNVVARDDKALERSRFSDRIEEFLRIVAERRFAHAFYFHLSSQMLFYIVNDIPVPLVFTHVLFPYFVPGFKLAVER